MTMKKTAGRSEALTVPKSQPLATIGMTAFGEVIGLEAIRKLPGEGGEVVSESEVMRVTGREHATRLRTVADAEIHFAQGRKPMGVGPCLGKADKLSWVEAFWLAANIYAASRNARSVAPRFEEITAAERFL